MKFLSWHFGSVCIRFVVSFVIGCVGLSSHNTHAWCAYTQTLSLVQTHGAPHRFIHLYTSYTMSSIHTCACAHKMFAIFYMGSAVSVLVVVAAVFHKFGMKTLDKQATLNNIFTLFIYQHPFFFEPRFGLRKRLDSGKFIPFIFFLPQTNKLKMKMDK